MDADTGSGDQGVREIRKEPLNVGEAALRPVTLLYHADNFG